MQKNPSFSRQGPALAGPWRASSVVWIFPEFDTFDTKNFKKIKEIRMF